DGTIVGVGRSGGRDRLYRIAPDGTTTDLDVPFPAIIYVAIDGGSAVFRAAATDRPWAVLELDISTGDTRELARSTGLEVDPAGATLAHVGGRPPSAERAAFG